MNFIKDQKKLSKIKEMAKNGDEKAKDFLFNFMEMSDDEANNYLSSIAVDENENVGDFKSVIEFLIDDENEAIDGYDKAIKFIVNSNEEDKDKKIKILEEIKNDELDHIKKLKEML